MRKYIDKNHISKYRADFILKIICNKITEFAVCRGQGMKKYSDTAEFHSFSGAGKF